MPILHQYQKIMQMMNEKYHYDLSVFQAEFFERVLARRMEVMGYHSFDKYLLEIQYNQEEVEQLWSDLHVSYSTFFRERLNCLLLEEKIIPLLVSRMEHLHGEIRVWVAGCANGEEAYSVAIILDRALKKYQKEVHFRIFATDVSSVNLREAIRGVYSKSALGNIPLEILEGYFEKQGSRYLVVDGLKQNITFSSFDLLSHHIQYPQESVYGGFDIITCCNVLYYYQREVQKSIIEKFRGSLKDEGYLFLGETERITLQDYSEFHEIFVGFPVFQKNTSFNR